MRFNLHSNVEDKHAFLGASKYHWVNYDLTKMEKIFDNQFASVLGTRKHKWAAEAILLGERQPRTNKTLNAYINDAIGFRMTPEVVLFVSDNCFGTADTISFSKNILRIHDLKTGIHPGNPHQIEIYFAFFCLEYRVNPYDIEMLGRIYQNDEVLEFQGDPKWIREIMDKIKLFNARIEEMKEVMM
jgi:hypothetical protein